MSLNDFLISKPTVVALNLIQCAAHTFVLFAAPPGSSEVAVLGYAAPFIAPALTLLFLFSKSPGRALAAICVAINLLVALCGVLLFFLLRGEPSPPWIFLVIGFSGVLVPSMSALAVAVRWPRSAPNDETCSQCGHSRAAHLYCSSAEPPTHGWIECPVKGCNCRATWDAAPDAAARHKAAFDPTAG